MIIRKASIKDLEQIMEIIHDAKQKFKNDGTNQWAENGYPKEETILFDLNNNEIFVLIDDDIIIGTCTVSFISESWYDLIIGKWLNDNPYAIIHRICLRKEYYKKGLSYILIKHSEDIVKEKKCQDIRVDTHEHNIAMRSLLKNCGYVECGIIYLERDDIQDKKRIAYHKILKED